MKKRLPFGKRFLLNYIWLRFTELGRTKFIADPSAFEVDKEFFKLNPYTNKEDFERILWERWESGRKFYLTYRKKA